jgi:hypothetical protein
MEPNKEIAELKDTISSMREKMGQMASALKETDQNAIHEANQEIAHLKHIIQTMQTEKEQLELEKGEDRFKAAIAKAWPRKHN